MVNIEILVLHFWKAWETGDVKFTRISHINHVNCYYQILIKLNKCTCKLICLFFCTINLSTWWWDLEHHIKWLSKITFKARSISFHGNPYTLQSIELTLHTSTCSCILRSLWVGMYSSWARLRPRPSADPYTTKCKYLSTVQCSREK